jgi:hypothetical protein
MLKRDSMAFFELQRQVRDIFGFFLLLIDAASTTFVVQILESGGVTGSLK